MVVNASSLAVDCHIKGKINKIMEVIMLKLLGINDALELVSETIENTFRDKGEEVIKNNKQAIEKAFDFLHPIAIELEGEKRDVPKTVFEIINKRLGDTLKVSEVDVLKDGTFPGGLSQLEKRNVSDRVAKWLPENCIECGRCSFVCPHAVIRSFKTEDKRVGKPLFGSDQYHYLVSISEADCTSCGLCINVCPGLNGKKALEFGKYDEKLQEQSEVYFSQETPEMSKKRR